MIAEKTADSSRLPNLNLNTMSQLYSSNKHQSSGCILKDILLDNQDYMISHMVKIQNNSPVRITPALVKLVPATGKIKVLVNGSITIEYTCVFNCFWPFPLEKGSSGTVF